jgi:two-component system, NtrC family, sensor kinase
VRRLVPSLGIVVAGTLLSAVAFATLRSLEIKTAHASFDGVAQERFDALEANVTLTINSLVSVGALYDTSHPIKREEFDRFTAPLRARNQAIQALEWIPRVAKRSRQKYEEDARRDGFPSFQFTERHSLSSLVRAGEREEYFPVFFVAPWEGNQKALGFDLASDPVRRAALQSSAASGRLVATNRVKLVQETSDQYGFLVFRPVYRGGTEPSSSEGRRLALIGFALAVFRVADIVEKAGTVPNPTSGLSLAIFDLEANPGERLLYPKGVHLDSVADIPHGFKATRTISVAGRTWELAAYPASNTFMPVHWNSWAAFSGGLLLTSMLSAYLAYRKRAEETLQQSEERARLLFATIPQPAYVADFVTSQFFEVNDAAVQQYGYSREEFLRMKTTEIRPVDEVERLNQYLKRSQGGKGSAGQWRHLSKDGRILDVEIYFHSLDYDGHKAYLAIAQDVTERNRRDIELRHAQKLEAVGSLAAGIAHEINTPIQFVGDNVRFLQNAFTDLVQLLEKYRRLRDAAALDGAQPAFTQEVADAEQAADLGYLLLEIPKAIAQSLDGVTRVADLVHAMKVFAHPEQKQKAAADINEALLCTLTVAGNELKYVADVETELGDIPAITCNIGQVNQVFLNLLVNAAHAIAARSKAADQKGLIRVRTSLEGDTVLVSIGDTGCGIPANIRDRVFDPFFTTKEIGRGTGQGLAIARSVVNQHGGTLTFSSEVGKGTTFYIRLPRFEKTRVGDEKTS